MVVRPSQLLTILKQTIRSTWMTLWKHGALRYWKVLKNYVSIHLSHREIEIELEVEKEKGKEKRKKKKEKEKRKNLKMGFSNVKKV